MSAPLQFTLIRKQLSPVIHGYSVLGRGRTFCGQSGWKRPWGDPFEATLEEIRRATTGVRLCRKCFPKG